MPDYTNWPVAADVEARLAAVGVSLKVSGAALTSRVAAILADVTGEVAARTTRQFIADTAPTVRYYDGMGTPILDVDEMVTFVLATAIGLNADPGYPLSNVLVYYEQGKPQRRLIRGQGGLPAFQAAAVFTPIPTIFPLGRQNIQVTANFGYGPAVPCDLWEAVACECARRLGNEAIFDPTGGITVSYETPGIKQRFAVGGLDGVGWAKKFAAKVAFYTVRGGRRLRVLKAPMI